jgi:hypothetical protein
MPRCQYVSIIVYLELEVETRLQLAHEKLNRTVLADYAATDPSGIWSEDWPEVWTETGLANPRPPAASSSTSACSQTSYGSISEVSTVRAARGCL